MFQALDYLREMNLVSVLVRLLLAMLFGGLIGLERERKRRPAGFPDLHAGVHGGGPYHAAEPV